jgi:very-short-patch-repair endonuclease
VVEGYEIMINGPGTTIRRARSLRRTMSLPEVLLWQELRKRPSGHKFRRQHPAGPYILDFFCAAARLAIEVDGAAHDAPPAIAADARRSHFLRSQGVATLRVPAKAVLADCDAVVRRIANACSERIDRMTRRPVPLHHPAGGPPPRTGEDL